MNTFEAPAPAETPTSGRPARESERTGAIAVLITAAAVFFLLSTWTERERVLLVPALLLLITGGYLLWRDRLGRISPILPTALAIGLLLYDLALPRILHHPQGLYAVGTWVTTHTLLWLVVGVALLGTLMAKREWVGKWFPAVLLALTLISGASLILLTAQPPIDVWALHQEAGDALLRGNDPYSDIAVASTFQSDDDSTQMTGYPYPALGLLTHGLSAGLLGDSRWASLVAWLAAIALMSGGIRRLEPVRAALVFLLASQPAWYPVLESAYSEPLSIALLIGALSQIWKRPMLGAVLLGLGVGSKQYFAVLLPLMAVAPALALRQRAIAFMTAVSALAAGAIWGLRDYVDAAILFHLQVPPQPRSINFGGLLSGLGVPSPPPMLTLLLSATAAVYLGRNARSRARLGVAAAAVLSIGFLLGPQAFANYWLLIGVLLLASVATVGIERCTFSDTGQSR